MAFLMWQRREKIKLIVCAIRTLKVLDSGHTQCYALSEIKIFCVWYPGIQGNRDLKFQPLIGENVVEAKCLSNLKMALLLTQRQKELTIMEKRYLHTHCVKRSNDSVELRLHRAGRSVKAVIYVCLAIKI